MVGAQPRARRDDTFAHAGRIDRQRRRAFENARAVAFRRRRERQRVIERMDGDRLEIIDGVIVALAVQHRAHALGRPAFDLAAEIVEEPHQAQEFVAIVDLGHVEPAGLRIDAGDALFLDGVADVIEPGLGQRPQRLRALEADAADQLFGVGGKARQHEAGIAAGRARRQPARFQQHDRPAGPRQFARRRQPGKAAADHADIDVEIDVQRRPPRRVHHGGGVPALAIGCGIGFAHIQRPFRSAAAGRTLELPGLRKRHCRHAPFDVAAPCQDRARRARPTRPRPQIDQARPRRRARDRRLYGPPRPHARSGAGVAGQARPGNLGAGGAGLCQGAAARQRRAHLQRHDRGLVQDHQRDARRAQPARRRPQSRACTTSRCS